MWSSVDRKRLEELGDMFRKREYRKCAEWLKSPRWVAVGEEELRGKQRTVRVDMGRRMVPRK